jgi:hypothetical protein
MVNPFTDHPTNNGMTYLGHLWVALWLAFRLGLAAAAVAVHAVVPALFNSTAGSTVAELNEYFVTRRTRCASAAKADDKP